MIDVSKIRPEWSSDEIWPSLLRPSWCQTCPELGQIGSYQIKVDNIGSKLQNLI
jgi:hypothetical protein